MPLWARSQTSPDLKSQGQGQGPGALPTQHGKRHLPQPRGPHSVGFVDVMTPGLPHEGTFFRVFYPTNEQCLDSSERWPIWAEDKYLIGMLSFMQVVIVIILIMNIMYLQENVLRQC